MTAMVAQAQDALVTALLAQRQVLDEAPWVRHLREAAAQCAASLSLPSPREEAWRFTDLTPLREARLSAAERTPGSVGLPEIAPFLLPEAQGRRAVFVDGVFSPALSDLGQLGEGLVLRSLASEQPEHLAAHLTRHAPFRHEVFPALNAACWLDGAVVEVSRRHQDVAPLHLLFVSSGRQGAVALNPRCLLVMEPHSRLDLVEDYVSLGEANVLTNAVSELVVGPGAELRHTKLQRQADATFWLATTAATIARDGRYRLVAVALGSRLARHDLLVEQAGEGGEVSLDGLALVRGRGVADTHSVMDHAFARGTSVQRHKCVVADEGRAVFNGRIVVRPAAQQTASSQASRNLLLSERARVDTKPQLEIFADDVKCSHGATVGALDEDEVFYLRSRGLSEARARDLLVYAFAAEIVEAIPVASLRETLREALEQRLHREGQEVQP